MSTLKELRLAAGLSAAALADKASTFEMRIYAFERRRYPPRPAEAKRIAKALNADPAALFPNLAGKVKEGGAR